MVKTIKRRRGRPPGSTKVPPDLLADIWIAVWLQRVSERIRTGKTPSVRQACHDLAARGGVISVVGGNQLALEGENVQRKKRWQRFDSTGASLTPHASGPIFASHTLTNAETLEARYSEADKLARSDRRVRLFWTNIGRQKLGRSPKQPSSANLRRPG
jgi:hypothetical protein